MEYTLDNLPHCNSSAFGFLLQASSHTKPLRGGFDAF